LEAGGEKLHADHLFVIEERCCGFDLVVRKAREVVAQKLPHGRSLKVGCVCVVEAPDQGILRPGRGLKVAAAEDLRRVAMAISAEGVKSAILANAKHGFFFVVWIECPCRDSDPDGYPVQSRVCHGQRATSRRRGRPLAARLPISPQGTVTR